MIVPLSADQARTFRDFCRAAGYTHSWLIETVGLLTPPPADQIPPQAIESLGSSASTRSLLTQLFFFGMNVDRDIANAIFPSGLLAALHDCGLVIDVEQSLSPVALVVPVGDDLLASDLQQIENQEEPDFVPPLCDAALHLSAMAIRRPVQRSLDLCSGFALHGIQSSTFSDSVVTTDLNPRAAGFARFNAALNGRSNVRAVTGDLFAAVEGESFDLILANPPFVISPGAVTTFRYNPMHLDAFVEKMLRAAPQHLNEGGILQTICEWVEIAGQPWKQRLASWLKNSGCDAWILPANRQLPATYAHNVLSQTISDPAQLQSTRQQWERYFDQQHVEAIQGGFIFLRRRNATNWFDVTQLTKPIRENIGDSVWQGIVNRDLVFDELGDRCLLDSRLIVANDLRQVETSHWKDFRWCRDSIVLHLDRGLPVTVGIDEYVRRLIEPFDGSRTVQTTLDSFAKELGLPTETGRAQGLQIIRSMLRNGVLLVPQR